MRDLNTRRTLIELMLSSVACGSEGCSCSLFAAGCVKIAVAREQNEAKRVRDPTSAGSWLNLPRSGDIGRKYEAGCRLLKGGQARVSPSPVQVHKPEKLSRYKRNGGVGVVAKQHVLCGNGAQQLALGMPACQHVRTASEACIWRCIWSGVRADEKLDLVKRTRVFTRAQRVASIACQNPPRILWRACHCHSR